MDAAPLSAADVAAVTDRNNGYGYGGMDWIWVIVLFAIFGFGGNGFGFGRNGAGLTQAELQQGFDTQSLLRGQEGIKNGLCDGFFNVNTTMLQGFNGLGREILENRFTNEKCCCETNRNIDAVRYENAKNTCDIITAGNNNTQKILDFLTQDKIEALRTELQSAQLQLGNLAQTNTLINTLRPTPIPAYPTCSPYQAANYYNGFGGCGCNA